MLKQIPLTAHMDVQVNQTPYWTHMYMQGVRIAMTYQSGA